jgi:thiamine biosynthesis lipoprotein
MKKVVSLFMLLTITITLSACNDKDIISFELIGGDASYEVGDTYSESGFIAKQGKTDIADYVTITNSIDVDTAADYVVSYTLDYDGNTETLNRNIYYREEGCSVIEGTTTTQCTVNYSQYLNTYIKLKVYYEGDVYNGSVHDIFGNVESILGEYHSLSDKYENYDGYINVRTINDSPTAVHTIDQKLFDLIDFTITHQSEVDNLFNLALGPVLQIWHNYREDCTLNEICAVPSMTELNNANQYTDYNDITLDEENLTITMSENMSIDLGGVSKGYISNIIVEYLDQLNFSAYLLNNGESNISIGGTHPVRENGKFLLAVSDPTYNTPYYATVYLADGDQLVTSGDYQQNYMVDGELYHHIINPITLNPERFSRSVSIITSEAGLADLYSTAIFTMSIEDGITFVDSIDGLEAIWYGLDDVIYFSENFEANHLAELTE